MVAFGIFASRVAGRAGVRADFTGLGAAVFFIETVQTSLNFRKMKKLLLASLLTNLLLLALLFKIVDRFGGFNYVKYRLLSEDSGGSYQHRVELFKNLSAAARPAQIVFLGDSQVEQCEWRELLGDSLPIVNRGIVGDGSRGVFERIGPILDSKPAKIIVWLGVNDLIFGNSIEASIEQFSLLFEKMNGQNVVVLSVLPVNSMVKRIPVSNDDIRKLNEKLAQLAASKNWPFVNLNPRMADENGRLKKEFTLDGIHLNGAGYAEIGAILREKL